MKTEFYTVSTKLIPDDSGFYLSHNKKSMWELSKHGAYFGNYKFDGRALRTSSMYKVSQKEINQIILELRKEAAQCFALHGCFLDDVQIFRNSEDPGKIIYCVDNKSVKELKALKTGGMKHSELQGMNFFTMHYEELPKKLMRTPVCK